MRNHYRQALELVWRKPHICPICDSSAWAVGELVDMSLRDQSRTASQNVGAGGSGAGIGNRSTGNVYFQPPQVYVFVPVSCLYCGYTMSFHTGILDVRLTEEVKAVPPLRLIPEELQ